MVCFCPRIAVSNQNGANQQQTQELEEPSKYYHSESIKVDLSQQSSINDEAKRIVNNLRYKEWLLETPDLILSIRGDDRFDKNASYSRREEFIKQFESIIIRKKVWIFSDKIDSSITQEIFEAFQNIQYTEKVNAKSRICYIVFVNRKETSDGGQRNPVSTVINIENDRIQYKSIYHINLDESIAVEKLHQIRDAIEKEASKQNYDCPILQILTDGGQHHVDFAFETIKYGWPVLILDSNNHLDNNHVAENITKKYNQYYAKNKMDRSHKMFEEYKRRNPKAFRSGMANNSILQIESYFLLNFYLTGSNEYGIDEAIRQALYNWAKLDEDKQKRYFKKVLVGIIWNDIEYIIHLKSTVDKLDKTHLQRALINAILRNRVNFVECLFEHGASFQEHDSELTPRWEITKPTPSTARDNVETLRLQIKNEFYRDWDLDINNNGGSNEFRPLEVIRDWLLWSVSMNRPEMVRCLCLYSENPILASLFVAYCYQKDSKRAVQIHKQECLTNAEKCCSQAAKLIDQCHEIDPHFAMKILEEPSEIYFNQTPLKLAQKIRNREFIATKTMKQHFDKIWFGDINEDDHSKLFISFLIFILCILVFLIPLNSVKQILLVEEDTNMHLYKKIKNRYEHFYKRRVAVGFFYNIITYIIFLGFYSYLVLVNYFPLNVTRFTQGSDYIMIPVNEIIVHIFSWCFIIEEITELWRHQKERNEGKLSIFSMYYIENKWKILDLITYVTYFIGFISRFIVIEQVFIVSKIFICINLFFWYIRILQLFFASEKLGPKLLMILKTLVDLVFFICFILIYFLAYSITTYALITTNDPISSQSKNNENSFWAWILLRNVLEWGAWGMYGQVNLVNHDQPDGSTITVKSDAYGTVVFIQTIIFVFVTNVVLINILVALFNSTVHQVQESAIQSWPYHRFVLIDDYQRKSMLPPPYNLCMYFRDFCTLYCSFKKCKSNAIRSVDGLPQFPKKSVNFDLKRLSYIARMFWKRNKINTFEVPSTYNNVTDRLNEDGSMSTREMVRPSNSLNANELDSDDNPILIPMNRSRTQLPV